MSSENSVTRIYQPSTSCFIPLCSVLTSLNTPPLTIFSTFFEVEIEYDDDDDDDDDDDVEGSVHGR
jgi:hypothetical protein